MPSEQNSQANILSKLASTNKPGQNQYMIQETLARPSIEAAVVLHLSEATPEHWIKELFDYLEHNRLPEDNDSAVRIKKSSARYPMFNGNL